jgi:DNA-binding beta-propeller fold protein YncE
MKYEEGIGVKSPGNKIKVNNVITAVLVTAIIPVVLFLWFYYYRTNPLDEIAALVKPIKLPPQWVATIYGDGNVFLKQPRSVYVYNGIIYVSDTGNHRVVVFDSNGKLLRKFGDDDPAGQLMFPYGVTVVGQEVLVADAGLNRVAVFDMSGRFKRFFPVRISRPISIVYQGGKLYFTDVGVHQVVVTDTEGKELFRTGRSGRRKPGEFYYPNGLAVTPEERIIVADTNNSRVQVLDPQGKFPEILGAGEQKGEGYFTAPANVALDKEGNVYVADPINRWVSVIDRKGTMVNIVQQVGRPEAGDRLFLPTGVWVDDKQYLYVADYSASRIVIYKLL